MAAVDFLGLDGKKILVTGVKNKKSVAFHTVKVLLDAGAKVLLTARNEERRTALKALLPATEVLLCDFEKPETFAALSAQLAAEHPVLHGAVHSVAFANYPEGFKPFHETPRRDFLQAVDVSCYSLLALADALKDRLAKDGSVVALSISTTTMAAENYGYMAPIKAALDSSVVFLAKSFSAFSQVRFNAVRAGLLKTSASAGIPGYAESFLFAEQVIPRKQALRTEEVAHVVAFLLSPRSSGINAQGLVVDAGMEINYFDKELVRKAMRPEPRP